MHAFISHQKCNIVTTIHNKTIEAYFLTISLLIDCQRLIHSIATHNYTMIKSLLVSLIVCVAVRADDCVPAALETIQLAPEDVSIEIQNNWNWIGSRFTLVICSVHNYLVNVWDGDCIILYWYMYFICWTVRYPELKYRNCVLFKRGFNFTEQLQ